MKASEVREYQKLLGVVSDEYPNNLIEEGIEYIQLGGKPGFPKHCINILYRDGGIESLPISEQVFKILENFFSVEG